MLHLDCIGIEVKDTKGEESKYRRMSRKRCSSWKSGQEKGSSRFIVEREARNSNDGQAIVERGRATKKSLCGIVCFLLCQPFSQRLISL